MKTLILTGNSSQNKDIYNQIIDLILSGGAIKVGRDKVMENLNDSHLIAVTLDGDKVASTVTIKVPRDSYKKKVFDNAGVSGAEKFKYEIGYAVTDKKYTGDGLFSKTIGTLLDFSSNLSIYTTTRNENLVKKMERLGFNVQGKEYNDGIKLMTKTK